MILIRCGGIPSTIKEINCEIDYMKWCYIKAVLFKQELEKATVSDSSDTTHRRSLSEIYDEILDKEGHTPRKVFPCA